MAQYSKPARSPDRHDPDTAQVMSGTMDSKPPTVAMNRRSFM